MSKDITKPPPPERKGSTWVQTERAAHEAWSMLIGAAPAAARLMHTLVAYMEPGTNAVVASQATLGRLCGGMHRNTVRRAVELLEQQQWIEVVKLGGKGGALGYVVNSRVAWAGARDGSRYAVFNARVLASDTEQDAPLDGRPKLRQVPILQRGEVAIPSGPGLPPPSQPILPGLEPVAYRDSQGREFDVDPGTGELQQR